MEYVIPCRYLTQCRHAAPVDEENLYKWIFYRELTENAFQKHVLRFLITSRFHRCHRG